jgi:hypothetical protein
MARNFFALIILLFLSVGVAANTDNEVDGLIYSSLEAYKDAVLNKDGKLAYELIDGNTKLYYEAMINKVLYASEAETRALSLMDKMSVLMIRSRVKPELLKVMDGKDLFVYMVKNAMIGNPKLKELKVKVTEVNDHSVKSVIMTPHGEAPFGFDFNEIDGIWKIDLTSMVKFTNEQLNTQVQLLKLDENEMIIKMVENISDSVSPTIWQPIDKI